MKEYTYVSLTYEGVRASKLSEHRAVIDKYAAEGWRYAGHIIPISPATGSMPPLI